MSLSTEKLLFVVVGPTAVGKTGLCVHLAHKLKTVIVSADSRQFYREMSIGTAKPTTDEMDGIQHYFINNKSISEEFNVGEYEKEALACLENIFEERNHCILTGGSGLFIDAVCEGIDEMPRIPSSLREKLNKEYQENGLDALVAELHQKDPKYFEVVDVKNPQRIIRALEVCRYTGMPFTSFRKKIVKKRPFKVVKIGLVRERNELYKRIDNRIDEMIVAGLFDEVESLIEFKNHNALNTVGYKEVFNYMDGEYDKEEAIRLLKRNSRRYAKRQITWFKRYNDIEWFKADDINGIEKYIEQQMDLVE